MHVLCVSGWGKADLCWNKWRKWWREEGITTSTLQTSPLDFNFGPIQAAAKQLARQIDDLKYPPIIVGHSAGGLIARYALAKYQPEVSGLITIASPLYGTKWARLAPWSYSAAQMVPGNPFLRRLEVLPDPQCPALSIFCSHDLLVKRDSALLQTSGAMSMEVPHTHTSVLLSRQTWATTNEFVMACFEGDVEMQLLDEQMRAALEEDDDDAA